MAKKQQHICEYCGKKTFGFYRSIGGTSYREYICKECILDIYSGKLESHTIELEKGNDENYVPKCTGKLFQYTALSCNGTSPMNYGYRPLEIYFYTWGKQLDPT